MLEPEKHDEQLRTHVAAFLALLAELDPGAEVPTCPGWTVRDLVDHLGYIHAWARQALVEGEPAHPPEFDHVEAPDGVEELVEWTSRRAEALLAALDDVGTHQPCWGFGERPRTSAFWWRRMTHEMAVHLHDLRSASAGSSAAVSEPVWDTAEMAGDAVDEVARMFFPRQVRLERCEPLQATALFMPDDLDGIGWVLAGDGSEDDAIADVTISGPVEQLALLLWRRVDLDDERLTVQGSRGAAEHVVGSAIVP